MVERVYSRGGYIGKERKSEKYRESLRRIQRENECGN